MRTRNIAVMIAAGSTLLGAPAAAQQTTVYTYDARGRLVAVTHSGGPANGVSSNYSYDAADNRTNVTVTGAPDVPPGGPGVRYVVVPLNGYTLIFIPPG